MPGDPRLRASDSDRERTVELLREHHAVGRITAEEYDERLNKVFAAKTLGELNELLADLPAIDLYQLPSAGIRPVQRPVRTRLDRRGDGGLLPRHGATWGAYMTATLALIAVWLVVGVTTGGLAWVPWFLLIVIPWGVTIVRRPQS